MSYQHVSTQQESATVSVIPGGQSLAEMESNVQAAAAAVPAALWPELRSEGLIAEGTPGGGG